MRQLTELEVRKMFRRYACKIGGEELVIEELARLLLSNGAADFAILLQDKDYYRFVRDPACGGHYGFTMLGFVEAAKFHNRMIEEIETRSKGHFLNGQ